MRSRPSFNNIRSRGRTTAVTKAPPADDETVAETAPEASTTPKPRSRVSGGSAVRPLRPGPRINIGGRGRLGLSTTTTTTTTEATAEEPVKTDEDSEVPEEKEEDKVGRCISLSSILKPLYHYI